MPEPNAGGWLAGPAPADVVERMRNAVNFATPCLAPDMDRYWQSYRHTMFGPVRGIRGPAWAVASCDLFHCPTAERIGCGRHPVAEGCCDQPDLHQRIYALTTEGESDAV